MTTQTEAMKLALEALEDIKDDCSGCEFEWSNDYPLQAKAKLALEEALAKQEQGEPVAWFREEKGEKIYYATKAWDDCLPLYTALQQRKPLTDAQKDAARYRWLFNDVDLVAIKAAFDSGTTPPDSPHSEIIGEIIGFYTDKHGADMMIDAAIKAAHGIKGEA